MTTLNTQPTIPLNHVNNQPIAKLVSFINKLYLKMEIDKGDIVFQATKEAFDLPSQQLIELLKKDRNK